LWLKKGARLNERVSNEYSILGELFTTYLCGTNWNIETAYAIHNTSLQIQFEHQAEKFRGRFQADPKTFNQQNWTSLTDAPTRKQVFQHLQNYADKFEWNISSEVKIIPVIHGSSVHAAAKICQSGFANLATLDDGYYGRGIYFTSFASYAAQYCQPLSISKQSVYVFIIASLIYGNTYPAIENPSSKENSLCGKSIIKGHQSHYALVTDLGFPFCDTQNSNLSNSVSAEKAESRSRKLYNELVIDQESQVFPLYLVFATKKPE